MCKFFPHHRGQRGGARRYDPGAGQSHHCRRGSGECSAGHDPLRFRLAHAQSRRGSRLLPRRHGQRDRSVQHRRWRHSRVCRWRHGGQVLQNKARRISTPPGSTPTSPGADHPVEHHSPIAPTSLPTSTRRFGRTRLRAPSPHTAERRADRRLAAPRGENRCLGQPRHGVKSGAVEMAWLSAQGDMIADGLSQRRPEGAGLEPETVEAGVHVERQNLHPPPLMSRARVVLIARAVAPVRLARAAASLRCGGAGGLPGMSVLAEPPALVFPDRQGDHDRRWRDRRRGRHGR